MDGNRPHLSALILLLVLAAVMITGAVVLSASDGSQSVAIIIAIAKIDVEAAPADFEFARRVGAAKVNGSSCNRLSKGNRNENRRGCSILIGFFPILSPAWAADSCRECRVFQKACLKAHSKAACQTDYSICMKHCRQR